MDDRGPDLPVRQKMIGHGGLDLEDLLVQNHLVYIGPTLSPVLFGPSHADPSPLGHLFGEFLIVPFGQPPAFGDEGPRLDLGLEKIPDLLAKLFLFFGEPKPHFLLSFPQGPFRKQPFDVPSPPLRRPGFPPEQVVLLPRREGSCEKIQSREEKAFFVARGRGKFMPPKPGGR